MANTDHPEKDLEDIMVHPLFRKAATTPAESWISTMASVNALLRDGINKDRLLIFTGDADGVSRYNGFDDIWDPKGDCKVRLENQDVRFNSKIIFETRSRDLIALISECVCEEGMHYNFRVPSLGDDVEKIGKHDLAIRNFIATIIRKPIIGTTLVSALENLQIIVKHIFRLQRQPEKAIEFVQEYVQDLKLDNCTNRPADIGLFLAWTERTHWSKAFVETFAHCVGIPTMVVSVAGSSSTLLSKVAVDIQGLCHSRGVEYFLNADLDGTPPWNPDDFPVTMRPVSAYYSWAALFAKANGPPRRVSRNSAKKGSKAKFNVEYLPDGRVMLKDADGHVVFR
ncbi:hypothetical protein D6D28_03786 [Aureobasidium pullulans]|uniref:DUF8004 domain-containing protein n=1 Tax=Aureobasidium pullulans TaxID=5580 RepID=A0A4S8SP48_AURPU|nr:hypothetical protein D6D28_03786 [Aureobasidium pullulans]